MFHGDALRAEVGIGEVAARVGHDPGHQGAVHDLSDLPVPLIVRGRREEGPHELGGGVREGGGSGVRLQSARILPECSQVPQEQVVQGLARSRTEARSTVSTGTPRYSVSMVMACEAPYPDQP